MSTQVFKNANISSLMKSLIFLDTDLKTVKKDLDSNKSLEILFVPIVSKSFNSRKIFCELNT